MPGPLEGIKVVDLSRVLAGPYCTMLLGDMGAEIVKIEQPGKGDDTRTYGPPFINDESAYFLSVNRNKRSLTLNLKDERGKKILADLLRSADVLVENFRPGKLADLGFGYEIVKQLNPQIVYCSISGYGHTGPSASLPGYDLIIQGEGGIASLTGEADGPPMKVGTSQADIIAGMYAFQGILLALLARQSTGRGQMVDIGMLDCQISLLTYQAGIYFSTGESPQRLGNRHPTIVPYETFQCRDGYVNLACGNDSMWRRYCALVGLEPLADDPRFRTNTERVRNRDELLEVLNPLMLEKNAQDWVELLRPNGVPCARIQSVDEACEHPQTRAREMVVEVEHPRAGSIRLTGVPAKLSETPGGVREAPPMLGQHTAQILEEWLSIGDEALATLRAAGVV